MSKIPKRLNSSSRPFIVPTSLHKSFATTSKKTRNSSSEIFYSLASKEETLKFNDGAMKRVSSDVRVKQKNDKNAYLEIRYKAAPPRKYNFPEATSWRYGWFYWKSFDTFSQFLIYFLLKKIFSRVDNDGSLTIKRPMTDLLLSRLCCC